MVDLSLVAGAKGAEVEAFDLSDAPPAIADAVEILASRETDSEKADAAAPGFVYVEVGRLGPAMLRFGLAPLEGAVRDGEARVPG